MDQSEKYLVQCDERTSEVLQSEMRGIPEVEIRTSTVNGIAGGATEMIVFGTVVLKGIAALLDAITKAIATGRAIKKLKIGDSTIVNPKESDIQRLRKQLLSA